MNIRPAVVSDLSAIVEIYNAAIPGRLATADTKPVSVQSRLGWFQNHSPTKYPIWVIGAEPSIAGWISLQPPFNGRPAYHRTVEVSVYVNPADRGMGMGKKLVDYAIRQSAELGIATFLGLVFAHNQPSLNLFTSFGFQQWGYIPRVAELDGIERDLVIIGLRV